MRAISVMLLMGVLAAGAWLAPETTATSALNSDACPQIVQTALDATSALCDGAGRNEACYGHVQVAAQAQPGTAGFVFDQEGDIVGVGDVQSLRLSSMDLASGAWGVALLRVQANLPDTTPVQNVTLLMFGDVAVENGMTATTELDMTVQAAANVNVRQQPSRTASVIGKLAPGQVITATGRLDDSSWVRVALPDNGGSGWVSASLLAAVDGDVAALDAVEAASQVYGPMQAFYFESGGDDAMCPEAPNSGLVIQTPEGVAEVTLLINEVDIQLGSTVYFQAQPGERMVVRVVEGHARVTVDGVTQTAYAGSEISVPLGDDGKPSGPPSAPTGYDMAAVESLPMGNLQRAVTIHPALTQDEIDAVAAQDVVTDTASDDAISFDDYVTDMEDDTTLPPGMDDNPGLDGDVPPGLDGNPALENPGLTGDTPPGLDDNPGLDGGVPPGQEDKDKKDKKDK